MLVLINLIASNAHAQHLSDRIKKDKNQVCYRPSSVTFHSVKPVASYTSLNACLQSSKFAKLPYAERYPPGQSPKELAIKNQNSLFSSTLYNGFNRHDWPHWMVLKNSCMDLENGFLTKQSTDKLIYNTSRKCIVKQGRWISPISNTVVTDASKMKLSHIVPLDYAYRAGGKNWSPKHKKRFANDINNVFLITSDEARFKTNKGVSEYAPSLPAGYRCHFVARFDGIMRTYRLSYLPRDLQVMNRLKRTCHL